MSGVILNWLSAFAVRFAPSGTLLSTSVQGAIQDLDSSTVKLTGSQTISGIKTTSADFRVASTTPSTSTTTGALTVTGGLGVAGTSYFGNSLFMSLSDTNGIRIGNGSSTGFRLGCDNSRQATIQILDSNPTSQFRVVSSSSVVVFVALNSNRILIGSNTDNGVDRLQVAGTVSATQYKLSSLNTAPATATDTGTTGEIRIDANYVYICTATNTWKRSPLTSW